MKKPGKILIAGIIIFFLAAGSAFSKDLDDLQKSVGNFSKDMAKSLPFNSTMGLNWADAYIGKFFPSIPPHFGFGVSVGTTFLDIDAMNEVFGVFDGKMPDSFGLPLLGYTMEGRLGGIGLPFDIGFKIGFLPDAIPLLQDGFGIGLKYFLVGADIRYSIIPEKIPLVRASIGLGYNYLNGGISKTIPTGKTGQNLEFGGYKLNIEDPTVGLRWETNCIELKAQASLNFLVVAPYIGIGLNWAMSSAGYAIDSKITLTDSEGEEVKDVSKTLKDNKFGNINVNKNGIESMTDHTAINTRVYGGMALNMGLLKLDITGMFDIFTQNYGGTIGIRFQL